MNFIVLFLSSFYGKMKEKNQIWNEHLKICISYRVISYRNYNSYRVVKKFFKSVSKHLIEFLTIKTNSVKSGLVIDKYDLIVIIWYRFDQITLLQFWHSQKKDFYDWNLLTVKSIPCRMLFRIFNLHPLDHYKF